MKANFSIILSCDSLNTKKFIFCIPNHFLTHRYLYIAFEFPSQITTWPHTWIIKIWSHFCFSFYQFYIYILIYNYLFILSALSENSIFLFAANIFNFRSLRNNVVLICLYSLYINHAGTRRQNHVVWTSF